MGMRNGLIELAFELKQRGIIDNLDSVLDFGSQELRITYSELENLFLKIGKTKSILKKYEVLKKFPKGKRISTKILWKDLGFNKIFSFDINKQHNSLNYDLNDPFLDKNFFNTFDLVTDFGNNEHIYNLSEAYKTLYKVCKKDGIIWCFQSVFRGNGFYNFDQSFFETYAAYNQLSILYSAYVIHVGQYDQFLIPCNKDLLNAINLFNVKSIYITYVFRKNLDEDPKNIYQYGLNDAKQNFTTKFIQREGLSEKFYIPSKSITNYKKLAKKGDKNSIFWLRQLGIKY
jgi:hypothetical protein